MNKSKTIAKLKELSKKCQIADVTCKVCYTSAVGYQKVNTSILVTLVPKEELTIDDKVVNMKHWHICGSITDFRRNVHFNGNIGLKSPNGYFVEEVLEVKPFVTDFKQI